MTEKTPPLADGKKEKYNWKFRLLLAVAPRFLYVVLHALFRTCRITLIGKEYEDRFHRQGKPCLFVSWHQGLLYFVYHFRNRNGLAMVSRSKDGELIARVLKVFGFQSARGSSSRDGREALRVMIDKINRMQCDGGIAADAPRGPFGVAKIGIVKLAAETGLPLLPVMVWADKKILLNGWDKVVLPLPFTRLAFFYDDPVFVSRTASNDEMEKKRVALTDQLNRLHKRAREYFGEK